MIDIEGARTFLTVIETGTFLEESRRLNVTQSTVSARIKALEERLGQVVFERSKAGATSTQAGQHFERYARAIVRAWEQGRHQAGIPEAFDELLVVGGQYSLWSQLLTHWLLRMRTALPRVAFRAEVGTPVMLSQALSEGLIDIAILHQPRLRQDIEVELLMEDELVLVTTDAGGTFRDRYIYVDWGPSFADQHAQRLPELLPPRTTIGLGCFSAPLLISAEAAGYMPRRLVEPHLRRGYLFETEGTPGSPIRCTWRISRTPRAEHTRKRCACSGPPRRTTSQARSRTRSGRESHRAMCDARTASMRYA